MKFATMSPAARASWLDWANSHDWGAGRARWNADGTMRVASAIMNAADPDATETYNATSPADLRGWAGY